MLNVCNDVCHCFGLRCDVQWVFGLRCVGVVQVVRLGAHRGSSMAAQDTALRLPPHHTINMPNFSHCHTHQVYNHMSVFDWGVRLLRIKTKSMHIDRYLIIMMKSHKV